jgi:hypothetical protein
LPAAAHKSPLRASRDADVTKLFGCMEASFRKDRSQGFVHAHKNFFPIQTTGYRLRAGRQRNLCNSVHTQRIFFLHSGHSGSGAYPVSYPVGTGNIFPGLQRQERKAGHSPPYSTEIKNGGAIPQFPHTSSRPGEYLCKCRDNFNSILPIGTWADRYYGRNYAKRSWYTVSKILNYVKLKTFYQDSACFLHE